MQHVRVSEILSRFRDFSKINPTVLSEKAQVGTEVHCNIHRYKTGKFEMFDKFPIRNTNTLEIIRWEERGQGYFNSFVKWDEENESVLHTMENRFYDNEIMLTGQIDALMQTNGLPVLIDFKCSANSDVEVWSMQAHLYKHLLNLNGIEIDDYFLWMQLKKDGSHPKIFEIKFEEKIISKCIQEVIKYWEEKSDAKQIA